MGQYGKGADVTGVGVENELMQPEEVGDQACDRDIETRRQHHGNDDVVEVSTPQGTS